MVSAFGWDHAEIWHSSLHGQLLHRIEIRIPSHFDYLSKSLTFVGTHPYEQDAYNLIRLDLELSEHVEETTHLSPQIPPFLFSQLSLHAKVFAHVFNKGVPGFCMDKCGYSPFFAEPFLLGVSKLNTHFYHWISKNIGKEPWKQDQQDDHADWFFQWQCWQSLPRSGLGNFEFVPTHWQTSLEKCWGLTFQGITKDHTLKYKQNNILV